MCTIVFILFYRTSGNVENEGDTEHLDQDEDKVNEVSFYISIIKKKKERKHNSLSVFVTTSFEQSTVDT